MENCRFMDDSPIEHGDFAWLCKFTFFYTHVYIYFNHTTKICCGQCQVPLTTLYLLVVGTSEYCLANKAARGQKGRLPWRIAKQLADLRHATRQ